MPGEPSVATVHADNPQAAFDEGCRQMHAREGYILVLDDVSQVREAIQAKLTRVLENGALYADKVASYRGMLQTMDAWAASEMPPARQVVHGLFLHGDTRVVAQQFWCVKHVEGREHIVFGLA